MNKYAINYEDLESFRGHQQTPQRFPIRNPRQTWRAHRARQQRAGRKARPQRSVPLRIKQKLSRSVVCAAAGFDGVMRDHYER